MYIYAIYDYVKYTDGGEGRTYRLFRDLLLQEMTDHDEQIDQNGAGQGRIYKTGSACGSVQPRRVRANDETDAGQTQYLKMSSKKRPR